MKNELFAPMTILIVAFAGGIALAVFILMLLWNSFLVPAVSVTTINYVLALKGYLLIAITIGMFVAAKHVANFIILNISMAIARRKIKDIVDSQDELLKHFKMFGD